MHKQVLTLGIILLSLICQGQSELYLPLNIQKAYEEQTRDQSGLPGNEYWQNEVSYTIDVQLEPSSSKVSGREKIVYKNNSPDTLREIVLSILADIYKKGNLNDFNIPLAALNDGVEITQLSINNKELALNGKNVSRSGTNLFIKPENEVFPGETIVLELAWNFIYPKGLTIRCGDYRDSTFFVAYFYPKIAVYDDLDGWDRHNYTGFGEFFGELADYDVRIKVPKNFKVWSTGELQNAEEVLSPDYYEKWRAAQQSMEVYRIITEEDYLNEDITKDQEWNTWNYKASGVPDFAFGSSDKFLWDAINVVVDKKSGRKATVNAAYRVDSEDYYKMAELGKKVLIDYSQKIPGIPYPYPEMTVFNGNSGMEFPMMCNNVSCEPWYETAGLAYHEIAHTYVPFYVPTNERKYAWMDEGWASLLPYFFFDSHSPEHPYFEGRMDRYYSTAGMEIEVPSMTLGDILTIRPPYRQASYNKPFFAYYYLYELLGEEVFTSTLKAYINAWAGKHPMPYDFFNMFNTYSGINLDWYWKNWFFDRNHADQTLDYEKEKLVIRNKGQLYLPVYLDLIFEDGTNKVIYFDISIWEDGKNKVVVDPDRDVKLIKAVLGNKTTLDVDKSNNVLEFK